MQGSYDSDLVRTREGARQETGTVIYDVLGGFHLVSGFTQDSGGKPRRLLALSG